MVKYINVKRGKDLFRDYILFSVVYKDGRSSQKEYEDSVKGINKLRKEWSWLVN